MLDGSAVASWLREAGAVVRAEQVRLTQLDAAIGDGDHGLNMTRGFEAVGELVVDRARATPGALLEAAGQVFRARVGGASGPLWGVALQRAGARLGDREAVDAAGLAQALAAAQAGIVDLGAAEPGDKTMLDALAPAVAALEQAARAGEPEEAALLAAARAAEAGAVATVPLLARKGRAAFLGERSIGHQDPGATSVALVMRALANTVARR